MEECSICLTEITQTDNVTNLGCCKQKMHSHCYAQCLLTKPACPLCRSQHIAIDIPNQNVRVVTVIRDVSQQTRMRISLVSFLTITAYIFTFSFRCNFK